jgi:hypothetical protein
MPPDAVNHAVLLVELRIHSVMRGLELGTEPGILVRQAPAPERGIDPDECRNDCPDAGQNDQEPLCEIADVDALLML